MNYLNYAALFPDGSKFTYQHISDIADAMEEGNKEELGKFAYQISQLRAPEPYKGKGIIIKGQEKFLLRKRHTN